MLRNTAAALALLAAPAAAADLAAADSPDTIVVTGERVARTLQDTASSVFVLTAEDLARQGPADLDDILSLSPNLTIGDGDSGITIRGQDTTGVLSGADAFLGGSRPRATLSVDGRPLSFNEYVYAGAPIWDVERVEIFRGPQTTTQGRNAVAGAIFVTTRGPTDTLEGRARFQAGDFGLVQGSAALGGPIVGEELTARVAFDIRDQRSFVKRPNYPQGVGADGQADDLAVGRVKLRFAPAALPWLTALLTYSHLASTAPQSEAINRNAPGLRFRDRTDSSGNAAVWQSNVDSVVLDLDAELGGGFVWSNTLAYADIDINRFSFPGNGVGGVKVEEKSVESILRYGDTDDPLSGLAGVYYLDQRQDEFIDLTLFLGFGDFRDEQTSLGVFGEVTYRPVPRLALTAGGRYQRDNQDRLGTLAFLGVDYDETFQAFLPKASVSFEATDRLTVGATAARGFNPGGTTISFQTGFRDEFEEERLWNYELFARWTAPGGRFGLSANAFLTDYEDAQRPVIRVVRPGVLESEINNAEDARAYGLEVEASARPTPWLSARAGLGLLDTELRRYSIAADRAAIEGNAFERAPGLTASAALTLTPVEGLALDAQVRHTTSYFSDDANAPELRVDGFTLVDARAAYSWRNLTAFVFARNLFQEQYVLSLYEPGFATAGDPQRLGAGVEARF